MPSVALTTLYAISSSSPDSSKVDMANEPNQKTTQKTRPLGGDPIDIPIPSKRDVLGDLAKTARPKSKPLRAKRKRTK